MDVTLKAISAQSLSAVSEALKDASPIVADVSAQSVLGGENLSVSHASPDLDAILAQLRMETNDARLNAARHRLASALSQLADLSESNYQPEVRVLAALDIVEDVKRVQQ